jgi:hypothetical protein
VPLTVSERDEAGKYLSKQNITAAAAAAITTTTTFIIIIVIIKHVKANNTTITNRKIAVAHSLAAGSTTKGSEFESR